MEILIREERTCDHRKVEELTREAFWNIYGPGCQEHYFVHTMREHPDFVRELALVAEVDDEIVGNIMYTKSRLKNENGELKEILSFGPISVAPKFQRKGVGKALIEASFLKALELGYNTVVIFGNPGNYVGRGFVSCVRHNVSLEGGICPVSLLVKELVPGTLKGHKWQYISSFAEEVCGDEAAVEAFDATFPPKEKKWQPSQEEFYIYSHSTINP